MNTVKILKVQEDSNHDNGNSDRSQTVSCSPLLLYIIILYVVCAYCVL